MQVQGQGLGIIIWALAKICYDPVKIRSLLQAFAQEAIYRLTQGVPKNEPNLKLGPQSLSNIVYAYAVMGHHPGNDLLAAIAQGVQGQLRDFSPQVLRHHSVNCGMHVDKTWFAHSAQMPCSVILFEMYVRNWVS